MSSRMTIVKRLAVAGALALAGVVTAPLGSSSVSAAPSISPATQTVTATVGTAITATSAYTDAEFTRTKSFSIVPGLPAGLSFNSTTGVVSGTPTAAQARTVHTVTASDGVVSATATITLTVTATTALTPTPQVVMARVGTAITPTTAYTATGLGTSRTFTVSPALPAGLSIAAATGVISGTPTATSATTAYTVTASDGTSSATARVSITVLAVGATGPTISPATQAVTGAVGTAITATRTFSDTDFGGVKEFSISPVLPAGLTLNTTTGVISGTPTAAQATATHTITAQDGSVSATASVTITITGTTTTSTTVPATTTNCPAVNIAGRSIVNVLTPQASLPSANFACGVRIATRANRLVLLAIGSQGTTTNAAVARYTVAFTRVNGGTVTRTLSVPAAAGVLRANVAQARSGVWNVTVTALSSTGSTVGTWTSPAFQVG